MPELPDVALYVECLRPRVVGEPLRRARVKSVFLVRTVDPPLSAAEGRRVTGVQRLGKRVVLALEEDLFLVFHLMIAGRFRWGAPGAGIQGRIGLAAFDFPKGTLLLTEASSRRRASLHVLLGRDALERHDPKGLEVLDATPDAFREALSRENHTLKRALTDPRLFSGIGNAYSDEILHRARLSPLALTSRLTVAESERLLEAAKATLLDWTRRLREEVGDGFPTKVTAFREGMAVHGRFGKPCPDCGAPVQRIVYAENETNYCASCQTGGKLLADRALSRLLKDDWPKTLAEWDELFARG
ncbi:MAG: formamidopyrimidine-DNA glycosylase [Planctomycetes bacterium]|nr:formamidopyrimidine-DNA glycosylase [Planctomycetota bacterium]